MLVIEILGTVIIGFILLFVIELFVVAFLVRLRAPEQRIERIEETTQSGRAQQRVDRTDVSFEVAGITVRAWLYLPTDQSAPVPCIVMGHGLGGTKDLGLDAYASRFQREGYAVLAFDYRFLGASDGEPRQLVWIPYQLDDYHGAVAYARSLKEIDPDKIALWGTSLSGGHAIVVAAHDHRIACIVAQVPWLDGTIGIEETIKREGFGRLFRIVPHGQRDFVRSWFGMSPHRIPLFGKPGTVAVLADQHSWDAVTRMASDTFVNEVCARIVIRMDKYRPVRHLKRTQCPVLIQLTDRDFPLPKGFIKKIEKALGSRGTIVRYPICHFDIYSGEYLEKSVNDHIAFFKAHLS